MNATEKQLHYLNVLDGRLGNDYKETQEYQDYKNNLMDGLDSKKASDYIKLFLKTLGSDKARKRSEKIKRKYTKKY